MTNGTSHTTVWARLIVIRHTEYDTNAPNDETAPLTAAGLTMAQDIARQLNNLLENETAPALLRSSPAERTRVLARLIGKELGVTPSPVGWLMQPPHNPSALMMQLARVANGGVIILCAHEPFVKWLLARSGHHSDGRQNLGEGHQFQIDPRTGETRYLAHL